MSYTAFGSRLESRASSKPTPEVPDELVSSPRMHVWAMSTSGFTLFKNVHDTFSLRNLSFSVLPPCWLQL